MWTEIRVCVSKGCVGVNGVTFNPGCLIGLCVYRLVLAHFIFARLVFERKRLRHKFDDFFGCLGLVGYAGFPVLRVSLLKLEIVQDVEVVVLTADELYLGLRLGLEGLGVGEDVLVGLFIFGFFRLEDGEVEFDPFLFERVGFEHGEEVVPL